MWNLLAITDWIFSTPVVFVCRQYLRPSISRYVVYCRSAIKNSLQTTFRISIFKQTGEVNDSVTHILLSETQIASSKIAYSLSRQLFRISTYFVTAKEACSIWYECNLDILYQSLCDQPACYVALVPFTNPLPWPCGIVKLTVNYILLILFLPTVWMSPMFCANQLSKCFNDSLKRQSLVVTYWCSNVT